MYLLPTDEIRTEFPALQRLHAGLPAAYFDGPGGTQVPNPVPVAMADYLFHRNSNAHWAFPTSAETDRVRHQAREAMADFLGARAREIVFGPNMTTLTYHLSRALGREMAEGDEIVVTELDHHANVDPWRALAVERGVRIRTLPLDPETGTLEVEGFHQLLSSRTRLVALGAASNALGTITDLPPLIQEARESGARVFVDAVHLAPHRRIQVRELGCDFLACSPYKFYGPHMGVLWMKEELLESLDVPRLEPAPEEGPERWESGTVNTEGMVGTTAAVDFLAGLVRAETDGLPGRPDDGPPHPEARPAHLDVLFSELASREGVLLERLWNGLETIHGVTLYGPPPREQRAPTLAFTVDGLPAREVSGRLADEAGTFLSHGDFYARTVARRLGLLLQGMVRAGISIYTTWEEVDRVVEGVAAVAHRPG